MLMGLGKHWKWLDKRILINSIRYLSIKQSLWAHIMYDSDISNMRGQEQVKTMLYLKLLSIPYSEIHI